MAAEIKDVVLFKETQRLRQWWIWVPVGIAAAWAWWIFLNYIVGNKPTNSYSTGAIWTLFITTGLLLPLFLLAIKMTTTVTQDEVIIVYFPLARRTIKCQDIVICTARDYHPIREYGGWGIRWGLSKGMAYTMYGNRGVQLELAGGKKLLIGSQQPEKLALHIKNCTGES